MKRRNKYFLYLSFVFIGLFVFSCFSIIYSVLKYNAVPESERAGNVLSMVALFLHLLIVAVGYYYSLKAYLYKSSLVAVVMVDDRGNKNPKAYRNALIVGCVFGVLGLFFALNSFGALHLTKVLSLSLNLELTNLGLGVSTISLLLLLYKPDRNIEVEVED